MLWVTGHSVNFLSEQCGKPPKKINRRCKMLTMKYFNDFIGKLKGLGRKNKPQKKIVRAREYSWKEKVIIYAINVRKDEIDNVKYLTPEEFQKRFSKAVPHFTRDIHDIYNFKETYLYFYIVGRPDRNDDPVHGYFFVKLPFEKVDITIERVIRIDWEFRKHYENICKRPKLNQELFLYTLEELLQDYARYVQHALKNQAIIVAVEGINDNDCKYDKVYYTDWYLQDR
jgi:hypothetical protein